LDYTKFIIQSFYKAKGDFVFQATKCCNSLPMAFNHPGKFLVGFKALPLQSPTPIFEELPRPTFFLVTPKLAKGFLKKIGGVQSLVGLQQSLQGDSSVQREVLPTGKQRILLSLNKFPLLPRKPGIFPFPYRIQSFSQWRRI
jgi:hypothetical protein